MTAEIIRPVQALLSIFSSKKTSIPTCCGGTNQPFDMAKILLVTGSKYLLYNYSHRYSTGSILVSHLLKDSSAAVHLLLLPCPEAAEVRQENRQ